MQLLPGLMLIAFASAMVFEAPNSTFPVNSTLQAGRHGCFGEDRKQSSQIAFCKQQYDLFIDDLDDTEDIILTSNWSAPADPFYALPDWWASHKDVDGKRYVCRTEVDYMRDEDRSIDDKTNKQELIEAGRTIFSACLIKERNGWYALGRKGVVSIRVSADYDAPRKADEDEDNIEVV